MESLQAIDPMTWIIIGAAVIICAAVLFAKAIKFALKLAVIAVMLLFIAYFLVQAGIIELPTQGH
jgi:hypothetical protein